MVSDSLYVLGDSIARGILYDESKGVYSLCRNTFDTVLKKMGVNVKNYSKMGCTSVSALSILDKCENRNGAIAAIEFGGNDSDLNWKSVAEHPEVFHEAAVTLPEFIQSIREMIRGFRKRGMRPVVVTPLPIVSERYYRQVSKNLDAKAILTYLGNEDSIYRWQERYSYAAWEAAHKESCGVFDLRSLFLNRRDFHSLMGPDGIHPNEKGYAVISEAVEKAWKNGL